MFTRRALDTSKLLADSLFGGRVPAVDMLATSVQWATGLGVIIVSSVAGLCLLVSMLRTYQEAARLPNAKCGEWRGPLRARGGGWRNYLDLHASLPG